MAAEAFDDPNAFDPHQVHVEQARVSQGMLQKRLGLVHIEAVNDPVMVRLQTRANGIGEVWMRR
jgi:hypothetical protein